MEPSLGRGGRPMIVKTATSVYEVQEHQRRFRKIHQARSDESLNTEWVRFERMGPVILNEPLRFFWTKDSSGTSVRFGVWVTGPLEKIIRRQRDV